MLWMLDTNICSYVLKAHPASVKERLDRAGAENVAVSCVVLAELYFGAARHPRGAEIRVDIDDFVAPLSVVAWDKSAAEHYGEIRAYVEAQGLPLGAMDLMIAAHARSVGAVLVTNNTKHFRRVPRLKLENWI
jgi:tRNA(fMet)-specific endonuclease VapC